MLGLEQMESRITFEIPSRLELEALALSHNYTVLVTEMEDAAHDVTSAMEESTEYEQLLADVWVGVVLTLMVLSCVCCMCSCLLYHKFQQWKRSVLEARAAAEITNMENGVIAESELPNYTLVSGLPSYDEAVKQLQQVIELGRTSRKGDSAEAGINNWVPHTPPTPATRLSVAELFQIYKTNATNVVTPIQVAVQSSTAEESVLNVNSNKL